MNIEAQEKPLPKSFWDEDNFNDDPTRCEQSHPQNTNLHGMTSLLSNEFSLLPLYISTHTSVSYEVWAGASTGIGYWYDAGALVWQKHKKVGYGYVWNMFLKNILLYCFSNELYVIR